MRSNPNLTMHPRPMAGASSAPSRRLGTFARPAIAHFALQKPAIVLVYDARCNIGGRSLSMHVFMASSVRANLVPGWHARVACQGGAPSLAQPVAGPSAHGGTLPSDLPLLHPYTDPLDILRLQPAGSAAAGFKKEVPGCCPLTAQKACCSICPTR